MAVINTYEFQPKLVVTTPLTDRLENKVTTGYDAFYSKASRRSGFFGSQDLLVYKQANQWHLLA